MFQLTNFSLTLRTSEKANRHLRVGVRIRRSPSFKTDIVLVGNYIQPGTIADDVSDVLESARVGATSSPFINVFGAVGVSKWWNCVFGRDQTQVPPFVHNDSPESYIKVRYFLNY